MSPAGRLRRHVSYSRRQSRDNVESISGQLSKDHFVVQRLNKELVIFIYLNYFTVLFQCIAKGKPSLFLLSGWLYRAETIDDEICSTLKGRKENMNNVLGNA